jgi:hypothetical protein
LAKQHLVRKITDEILKIQNAKYINHGKVSLECKNVVIGHAIDSFALFFDKLKNKKSVLDFVKKQINNSRVPVRNKAEKFLKIYHF